MAGRLARAILQLEACAELIDEGSVPSCRMAIVLLDNLADNFLYRRLNAHVQRSDERGFALTPKRRVTRKELDALEQSFPNKLRFLVAMSDSKDKDVTISTSDADILSISHRYRNAIYHRDTHNPAVVPVIARLLFGATCRLFPASYQSGWGTSVTTEGPSADVLNRYSALEGSMLWPHRAARTVAEALQLRVTVRAAEAVANLAADLLVRCDELNEMVDYLPPGAMGLEQGLAWTEFWHRHGYDAQLVKLADRADTWLRRNEANLKAVRDDAHNAQLEYNTRVMNLWKAYRADASLDEISRATDVASGLTEVLDLSVATHAYYEVDTRLGKLEELLGDMIDGYDREIDLQIQQWKGN